ncbi:PEP-CTERM sorting domain-containing protein [Aeoliella mucimassa]|uniref:PEP-CTERM protein-sorting domain-containing protein n=1 Tax=Aeoliella mucimassa TaxID=2527972 RepID=A0A518API6_9BACT|nr:PEP-CTERM sorting domain-containing protein [Aeoliella mucimassa]QDU56640.1 hypothetical protein Pan181_28500 [Aeoliella mucimassa]
MKTTFYLLLAIASLSIGISRSTVAGTIVLATQDAARDGDLIAHLQNTLGHTVTTAAYDSLDTIASDVDALNQADLVIVSRNTNSGNYASNPEEVAAWDSVQVPVILGNGWITRNSRWSYVDTGNMQEDYAFDISAPPGTTEVHPYFAGVPTHDDHLDGGPGSPPISGLSKYNPSADSDLPDGGSVMGDGIAIGVRNNVDFQNVFIASWQAGQMTGSGNVLGGDRVYFAMPQDFSAYRTSGVAILDNIVGSFVAPVPEPGSIVLLSLGCCALWAARARRP